MAENVEEQTERVCSFRIMFCYIAEVVLQRRKAFNTSSGSGELSLWHDTLKEAQASWGRFEGAAAIFLGPTGSRSVMGMWVISLHGMCLYD